jgi:hypothetical protein
LFFEKNANFYAENCQKSQKIGIITSTPGHTACASGRYFQLQKTVVVVWARKRSDYVLEKKNFCFNVHRLLPVRPDWVKFRHWGDIFWRWAHFFLKNIAQNSPLYALDWGCFLS